MSTIYSGVRTHSSLINFCAFYSFIPLIEPMTPSNDLEDPNQASAIQKQLNDFQKNKVWTLTTRPKSVIRSKWTFKNKLDEARMVV